MLKCGVLFPILLALQYPQYSFQVSLNNDPLEFQEPGARIMGYVWQHYKKSPYYDFNGVPYADRPIVGYRSAASDLIVQLNEPRAKIRGHIRKSAQGRNFFAYEGIPYAMPPIGYYRYAEPVPHPGWYGILNVTENRRFCMQPGPFPVTEDCLVLNVFSPVKNTNANLPVLFWIHGGGYLTGSGTYDFMKPNLFMDYGIVVVTINYRLGAFGFLTSEDGVIPGNLGMKDQLLALKWVNKNIAAFGGDPSKVTIAGQSAGSTSVSFHVLSAQSKGLFRGAILESGSGLMKGAYVSNARNYSFQLGQLLNNYLQEGDSWTLLSTLRSVSPQDILGASQWVQSLNLPVGALEDLIWGVVIEDLRYPWAFINEPMHQAYQDGNFNQVPLLTGYTSEEILFFARDPEVVKAGANYFDGSYSTLISPKWHIPPPFYQIAGRKMKNVYTDKTFSEDLGAYIQFSSDTGFKNPIIREAELASRYVPVYLYEFSFKGIPHMIVQNNVANVDGSTHGEELLFMWGAEFQSFFSEMDKLTSKRLLMLWTNFVRYQNPTPYVDKQFGLPTWPKLTEQNLVYLDIGSNCSVKTNPKHYLGYKAVLEEFMGPPYAVF